MNCIINNINKIFNGKYRVDNEISRGAFGIVYCGQDTIMNKQVAIKFEPHDISVLCNHQLVKEYSIYMKFKKNHIPTPGIPEIYWFGKDEDNNSIMVIELLEFDLAKLFILCDMKFSLKTVLLLADQMINRIELLHSKNYVHCDIKPENFMMGSGNKSDIVHLIDFGLSKKYRDSFTKQHIEYSCSNKSLEGTPRYASTDNHLGTNQSRRDDITSLLYVLIYLSMGSLPWQKVQALTKKEKYDKILRIKMATRLSDLCRGLTIEFAKSLKYSINLRFDDRPNYGMIRRDFRKLYQNYVFDDSSIFDWTLKLQSNTKIEIIEIIESKKIDQQSNENINDNGKYKVLYDHDPNCDEKSFDGKYITYEK